MRSAGRPAASSSREQVPGLVAQLLRRGRRLVGHLGADPRIAGVGVDEAGLEPVEAQPQPHVLQGEVEAAAMTGSFAARLRRRRAVLTGECRVSSPERGGAGAE